MEKEQVRKLLTILRTNYPQTFKGWDNEQQQLYMGIWCNGLKNDDYGLALKAIESFIYGDSREFAPNIGQVKDKMFELQPVKQIDAGLAWDKVVKAARCDRRMAKEEFDKLPTVIKQAVGTENFLVEVAWSDNESVKFHRKEFEAKLQEVLLKEKADVISGALSIDTMAKNNYLEERGVKNERNLLQEHTSK